MPIANTDSGHVYIKSMGQSAEVISGPLLKMLEERITNNEFKRKKLLEEKKRLIAHLEQLRIEVEKMKIQEENAKVQSSADGNAAISQAIEVQYSPVSSYEDDEEDISGKISNIPVQNKLSEDYH